MNDAKTLVVLAAGEGSRFGGPKQVEPVGPNGEFIMDYSIYSAKKYGFTKVVFVIRKNKEEMFAPIIERIKGKIDYDFAYQELDVIPEGFTVPEGRVKPWGTAHALYCAKDKVEGNFGVITSDDFYGDEAFKDLSRALDTNNYSVIGYHIKDTLSENGAVKRGVVKSENGIISKIIESSCELDGDTVRCTPLNIDIPAFNVNGDNSVSMLMNGFTKEILDKIEADMTDAFKNNADHLDSFEMLLPDVMDDSIKEGKIILDVPTNSVWMGMTYQSDKQAVMDHIASEIEKGIYPSNLWN